MKLGVIIGCWIMIMFITMTLVMLYSHQPQLPIDHILPVANNTSMNFTVQGEYQSNSTGHI